MYFQINKTIILHIFLPHGSSILFHGCIVPELNIINTKLPTKKTPADTKNTIRHSAGSVYYIANKIY